MKKKLYYISTHTCHKVYSLKHYVEEENTEHTCPEGFSENSCCENIWNIHRNTSVGRFIFKARGKSESYGFSPVSFLNFSEQLRFDKVIIKRATFR